MVNIYPTSDPRVIISLLTPGMSRRANEGYRGSRTEDDAAFDPSIRYLVAECNEKKVGFVSFTPVDSDWAIHLYLRTIGQQTVEIVRKALDFAFTALCAKRVYACYPATKRAVARLCALFGFTLDEDAARRYVIPDCQPLVWQRLDFNPSCLS